MKKIIYLTLGVLCLLIGAIGIIIPVLPTTPLLLAGAWFFARSSQKFHHWLLYHPLFGQYIRDYVEKKAVKKSARTRALMLLWSGMLLTMILVQKTTVNFILPLIGALVTFHLLHLKVLPESAESEVPEES